MFDRYGRSCPPPACPSVIVRPVFRIRAQFSFCPLEHFFKIKLGLGRISMIGLGTCRQGPFLPSEAGVKRDASLLNSELSQNSKGILGYTYKLLYLTYPNYRIDNSNLFYSVVLVLVVVLVVCL